MSRQLEEMSGDCYTERSRRMDDEYLAAWGRMPLHQRERLARLGINGPQLEEYDSKQAEEDVSEWDDLRAPTAGISEPQRLADEMAELFHIPPATVARLIPWIVEQIDAEAEQRRAAHLNRVVAGLLRDKNLKVSVVGLAFAAGISDFNMTADDKEEMTMRKAGRLLGVSTAYVSQFANQWCDRLCLPRPKRMKKQAARRKYSLERKSNHWRHQLCPPKKSN